MTEDTSAFAEDPARAVDDAAPTGCRASAAPAVVPASGNTGARSDHTIDHREFGRLLAEARESRGLTRSDVAPEAEITADTYHRIELGAEAVPLVTLSRLRQVLGFDVNPLLQALPVSVAPATTRRRKVTHAHRRQFGRYQAFGPRLIRARSANKLTLASLAAAVGLCVRTLVRFEGGHRLPSVENLAQLQRVLDFDGNPWLDCLHEQPSNEPFHGFGAIVRSTREALGVTSAHVARAAQCESHTYERIERGAEMPTIDGLVRLHRVLKFDVATALRTVWLSDAIDRLS